MVAISEQILWRGRPRRAAYVRRLYWPAALYAAAVLVFGSYWEWLAVSGHHLIVYPLCGSLFLVLGLYGLAVRPLLLGRAAARTRYLITERRVVWRLDGGRRGAHDTAELEISKLPPWFVVPRRGGADVVFFAPPPRRASPWGVWRLVEDQPRFACLSPAVAQEAAAALRAAAASPAARPSLDAVD